MALTFPLNFGDISLLLAMTAIILFVTSELISPYYGTTALKIDKKRLRNAAITMFVFFMVTVAMRTTMILLNL